MSAQTSSERSAIASIAANARWSREKNRSLATAAARAAGPGSLDYWMRRVDPDGEMTHADRVKAAENAKAEYYGRSMRNARAARRRKAAGKPQT
jgi:hypothetical protein